MAPTSELAELLMAAAPLAGMRADTADAVAAHACHRRIGPGETLVAQGDHAAGVYVVVSGRLRVLLDRGSGPAMVLGSLEAGAVIGEIAALGGRRRETTVVAEDVTTLVEVSAEGLEVLLDQEPDVAEALADLAADRLRATQLSRQLATLFPDVDEEIRGAMVIRARWRRLSPGEVLLQRGDPADTAYVVVSGRLRGLPGEDPDAVVDVAPGELVGEMAIIEGGVRSATLIAARETHVAQIHRDHLLDVLNDRPGALLAVLRTALRRAASAQEIRGAGRRCIALVALHPTVEPHAIAHALLPTLEGLGSTRLVTPATAATALGDLDVGTRSDGATRARLAQWLHEQEHRHETLVLVADPDDSAWSEIVLRQADHIALVADATRAPSPTAVDERFERALHRGPTDGPGAPGARTSLVLVHPRSSTPPRGTARWLARRHVDAWYHLRQDHPGDLARLARILAEQPVGLVLSGGGARGYAHLGAIRALEEAGVPIDLVGGTSMGAMMATFVALDLPAEDRLRRARSHTVRSPLDWTLPFAGLVKGARLAAGADLEVEGRDMEDLWLPWFAVSTNLSRKAVEVHRRGPVARALRASMAIPGLMPPVALDGDLHVDGGVLDNLPVRQMRRLNPRGTVIAVDVSRTAELRAERDFGLSISGWEMLGHRMRRGGGAAAPGIATTIVHAMLSGSSRARDQAIAENVADLYLDLDLPRCGLLEFDAAEDVAAAGYRSARDRVQAWADARQAASGETLTGGEDDLSGRTPRTG